MESVIRFSGIQYPLPDIGDPQKFWGELRAVDMLTLHDDQTTEAWRSVSEFVAKLPRPITLIHSIGNTNQDSKSLDAETISELYKLMLDQSEGSLILLDWDDRVPRLANYRVRHLADDWKLLSASELVALIAQSDLLIGVDSGLLHAARLMNTPAIGYFPSAYHYPAASACRVLSRSMLCRNRYIRASTD